MINTLHVVCEGLLQKRFYIYSMVTMESVGH